jgi:hypothetical protein
MPNSWDCGSYYGQSNDALEPRKIGRSCNLQLESPRNNVGHSKKLVPSGKARDDEGHTR